MASLRQKIVRVVVPHLLLHVATVLPNCTQPVLTCWNQLPVTTPPSLPLNLNNTGDGVFTKGTSSKMLCSKNPLEMLISNSFHQHILGSALLGSLHGLMVETHRSFGYGKKWAFSKQKTL